MKTLKKLIVKHNNDYGFSVAEVIQRLDLSLPSLSIVTPYFETGETFTQALSCLYRAIEKVKINSPDWLYEVIVIDDGSLNRKAEAFLGETYQNLHLFSNSPNAGRTKTRNYGLQEAHYEKCLFMDSDVLVSESSLLYHLRAHAFAHIERKKLITVGFFQFIEKWTFLGQGDILTDESIHLNDFRLDCSYGKTWIGCKEDKQFIGKDFRIVEDTDNFRFWPESGFFGPWFLTNMVLGGFFMVDTATSKEVFGFDDSFEGYGFTETSLPTKLIAGCEHFLVPITRGGCVHIDDEQVNVSRKDKDMIFQKKHDFYFEKYLNITWEQAIRGYGKKA